MSSGLFPLVSWLGCPAHSWEIVALKVVLLENQIAHLVQWNLKGRQVVKAVLVLHLQVPMMDLLILFDLLHRLS